MGVHRTTGNRLSIVVSILLFLLASFSMITAIVFLGKLSTAALWQVLKIVFVILEAVTWSLFAVLALQVKRAMGAGLGQAVAALFFLMASYYLFLLIRKAGAIQLGWEVLVAISSIFTVLAIAGVICLGFGYFQLKRN